MEDWVAVNLGPRDVVRKSFVDESVDRVHARLQLMVLEGGRDRATHVALAKSAILKDLDWGGKGIRDQSRLRVSYSALHGGHHIGREGVLIGELTCDFLIVTVLPLSVFLLDQLIWDEQTRSTEAHRKAQPVLLSQVTLKT